MAAENAAEVAALRGWKVYFNTLTIAGRRNVGDWGALVIATWGSIFGLIWLNGKRKQYKARKVATVSATAQS